MPRATGTTKRRAHSSDDERSLGGSNNNETIEEDFNTARTVEEEKQRKRTKRHLQKQTKEQNERNTSPQGGGPEEKSKFEVLRRLHWESAMAMEAKDRRQKEWKSHNNKGNELLEKGGCEISRDLSVQHKFSHSHTQRNETSASGRQGTERPACKRRRELKSSN